jgi:hypothetical protein
VRADVTRTVLPGPGCATQLSAATARPPIHTPPSTHPRCAPPLLCPSQICRADLPEGGGELALASGVAQRLLAPGQSVLDGDAFVEAAAEQLTAAHLRASLENCLLECTNTRLARPLEQASFSSGKIDTGVAGLVQQVAAGGGSANSGGSGSGMQLFPASAGLPSLQQLLHSVVLPPSATAHLMSAPAVQLFVAHSPVGPGRLSATEQYDAFGVPAVHERNRIHVRSAARRGGTYFTLLSGLPMWQLFELEPPAATTAEAGGDASGSGRASEAGGAQARQKRKQPTARPSSGQKQQQPQKQKQQQAAQSGGSGTARPPLGPCTLRQSACSCSSPDLGVLWCAHRCDAMAGLLADPALHVLDADALAALLVPLSARQLAQLLLTGERPVCGADTRMPWQGRCQGQESLPCLGASLVAAVVTCRSAGTGGCWEPMSSALPLNQLACPFPPPCLPCAVAFACGTLTDVVLSLQLPPARQAALFLPHLGSLPLTVPATSELRMGCFSPTEAALSSYYTSMDPYSL